MEMKRLATKPSAPAVGLRSSPRREKDYVPEFVGTGPMRDYERRVRLFEFSTGIDASFRAQKLMERLGGQTWLATETLPLTELKNPKGVDNLLRHLWQELEPLELRVFTTLQEFYQSFRRA